MSDSPLDQARAIGRDHGQSAASWVEINEVSAPLLIGGIVDDIDPAVMDCLPSSDLSGEWADGYTVDRLAEDIGAEVDGDEMDDLVIAYEDAFCEGVEANAVARCQEFLVA